MMPSLTQIRKLADFINRHCRHSGYSPAPDAPATATTNHGMELALLTEYHAGDDARAINWKSLLSGRTVTRKQFSQETAPGTIIALDISQSCQAFPQKRLAIATAAKLCLGTALLAGQSATVLPFAQTPTAPWHFQPGKRSFLKACSEIDSISPSRDQRTDILPVISACLKRAVSSTRIFILSDMPGDNWETPLARLAKRADVFVFLPDYHAFDSITENVLPIAVDIQEAESNASQSIFLDTALLAQIRSAENTLFLQTTTAIRHAAALPLTSHLIHIPEFSK